MSPLVPYEPELDDPKYDNDPIAKSLKTMFQVANVIGFDNANISTKGVNVQNLTNPYKCSVYRNGDQTGIADGVWTTVELNAENYDINNNFDTSTYTYTVPVTGYYYVHGSCYLTGTGCFINALRILKNSDALGIIESQTTAGAGAPPGAEAANVSGILYLTASDTLKLQAYGDVSSGTISTGDLKRYNFMEIHLISL